MKHILEWFRRLCTQLVDWLAAMPQRGLEGISEHSESKGWFLQVHDGVLIVYLLGTSLELPSHGLQLSNLELAYRALKQELLACYPEFMLKFDPKKIPIRLHVEVRQTGEILSDLSLLQRLEAFVETKPGSLTRAAYTFVDRLEATVELDGDPVTLRVVRKCGYKGFEFFVSGHPDSPPHEPGKFCRPLADILDLVADSDARR